MKIYWDLILSDKYLYHDSILMKHMLNFVDFTPKRLGQVASDSNGGIKKEIIATTFTIFTFKKLCM
jgi:hypothetical protein